MQTTRRGVRYYIDRDVDTPVVRSVPVSSTRPAHENPKHISTTASTNGQNESARTAYNASETRRRTTRGRLAEMVQTTVRRHRSHTP